jgi:hypothetical protein
MHPVMLMPELLTKHPEIVKKVLASEGAQCGTGARPQILTKCPPEKFCKLAGGELCIYGPGELTSMSQLAPGEVCKSSSSNIDPSTSDATAYAATPLLLALVGAFLAVRLTRRR